MYADDWISSKRFENLLKDWDEEVDCIIGSYVYELVDRQESKLTLPVGIYDKTNIRYVYQEFFSVSHSYLIFLWNKVCKANLIKDALEAVPDTVYLSEDRCASLELLLKSKKVLISDDNGYHKCQGHTCMRKDYLLNAHNIYKFMGSVIENSSYKDVMRIGLKRFMLRQMPRYLNLLICPLYWYPYFGRLQNSRIVLYGAGMVGKSFYAQIIHDNESTIVAWVDKNWKNYQSLEMKVVSPDIIDDITFDYIILAVIDENIANEMRLDLLKRYVDDTKILWQKTKEMSFDIVDKIDMDY